MSTIAKGDVLHSLLSWGYKVRRPGTFICYAYFYYCIFSSRESFTTFMLQLDSLPALPCTITYRVQLLEHFSHVSHPSYMWICFNGIHNWDPGDIQIHIMQKDLLLKLFTYGCLAFLFVHRNVKSLLLHGRSHSKKHQWMQTTQQLQKGEYC